jgi:DNA adenine methylase
MGGKSLLAETITKRIPEHTCYCEVFAGAAWLLFKKQESKVEIINDINVDLVTLFRVVKHHLDEFVRYLRWILVARNEFERFKLENPETLTDIQRAVRFYFVLKNSFSGRIKKPSFSISTCRLSGFNLLRVEEELSAIHLRLARVYIENKGYGDLIRCFDRPETFFYIDPPYYGCENYYGDGIFSREDFDRLSVILGGLKGKFILSINNHPKMRETFRGFKVDKVKTKYASGTWTGKSKAVTELLISNY